MVKTVILFICLITSISVYSQERVEVKGFVKDAGEVPLAAKVNFNSAVDTLVVSATEAGNFSLNVKAVNAFTLTISHLGYKTKTLHFSFPANQKDILLDPLILEQDSIMLDEVKIKRTNSVVIKEDTVQYNAEHFPVREGAFVKELIRLLPGLVVDKDGNISMQGKRIAKLRVNGKDFFGGEVIKTTGILPADMIRNIQVINDYGEQANLTGIKAGEPLKIINLTLKDDRNKGVFGQAEAGGGTNRQYTANANGNLFKKEKQLSGFLNFNNTNGRSDGKSTVNSTGINYRDAWTKKFSGYGNYNYSGQNNKQNGFTSQQSVFVDLISYDERENRSESDNTSHQFNYTFEYKPNTGTFFRMSPRFLSNYSHSDNTSAFTIRRAGSDLNSLNAGINGNSNTNRFPAFGSDFIYNQNFKKSRRNLSITGNINSSSNKQNQLVKNIDSLLKGTFVTVNEISQEITLRNLLTNSYFNIAYVEPLSKASVIQVFYYYNNSLGRNNRQAFDRSEGPIRTVPIDSLSNDIRSTFITNRVGANYQLNKKKFSSTISLFAQPVYLKNTSDKSTGSASYKGFNLLPALRLYYSLEQGRTMNFDYMSTVLQPELSQLQAVTDYSNPQYLIAGNPDLKPEIDHVINLGYNSFNLKTESTLFINASVSLSKDKILSNVIADTASKSIRQITTFLNADGYKAVSSNYSYSHPLIKRKLTVSLNGGINYSNNLTYINNLKTSGDAWSVTQGLNLRLNSKNMEGEVFGNYGYNSIEYESRNLFSTRTQAYSFGFSARNTFFKKWALNYDFTKTINTGYKNNISVNPAILNINLERTFLSRDRCAFRLQAFDVFNQNAGIFRSISGNTISDTRSSRISRYFLISLTFQFQKFN